MYEFKQAVKVNYEQGKEKKSHTFIQGRHKVSDDILASDDFLHFVKCGWIAEIDPQKAPAPLESFSERAQRLAKKLAEKKSPTVPISEHLTEPVHEKESHKNKKSKAEKGE